MVAIPKDGLFGVSGYRACLVEWVLCMSFTCGVQVKRLAVDCASGLTIFFCADNHAVAPCDRPSYRYWFKHAQ